MQLTTYLQIRSRSIIKYNLLENTGRTLRTHAQEESARNLQLQETYTGLMTKGAKKRLTVALENLVQSAKEKTFINPKYKSRVDFNLNFITLTIYSTDRNIKGKEGQKRLLEPFLLWMRRKHNCTMYVWKAELQKRGQLHYHITSDTYIPHNQIRAKWNQLQKEAGYIDSYFEKYGHYDPNGTDVHSVSKKRDIVGYLKKQVVNECEYRFQQAKKTALKKDGSITAEMAKDIQNEISIGGKVWDCSLNLKSFGLFTIQDWGETSANLTAAVKNGYATFTATDHCTIYDCVPDFILNDIAKSAHHAHKQRIINYKRITKPKHVRPNVPLVIETVKENAKQEIKICSWEDLQDLKYMLKINRQDKKPVKKVRFKPLPSLFSTS